MALGLRRRRPQALAASAADDFRVLVAAGRRIDLQQRKVVEQLVKARPTWHEEAWAYWYAVGELKYAARFQGNVLSRAKFFPALLSPGADTPVPVDLAEGLPSGFAEAARDEVSRLGDLNQLVRRLVVQWQVPGEGYLVGRKEDGEERWEIASRSQLARTRHDGVLELRYDSGDREGVPIYQDRDVLVRLWQEDEQWPGMSDSPMRAMLYEIEELLILGRHIRSVGRSRIANGSIFKLPSELSFGAGDELASPDGASGAQKHTYAEKVQNAFIEPIHDEGSAAAVAPIIIEGAHRYLDQVGYVEMPRGIDPVIDARIEKLFLRFARTWNLPPERILGMGGTTFANASQVERSEWDAHLAPLGEQIGIAFSAGWFRAAVVERNPAWRPVVRQLVIAVDPARAVTNPTLAKDAVDAHKAIAISDATLRRALGFDEGDRPNDEELARRIAVAKGTVDSNITQDLLTTLLVAILGRERVTTAPGQAPPPDREQIEADREREPPRETPQGRQDPVPREAPQAVSTAPTLVAAAPERELELAARLVDLDQQLLQRLLVALDAAVSRGLERAGSRLRAAVQSSSVAASVKGVAPERVGFVVGRDRARELGVDEDRLVGGVFEEQRDRYARWVERAQEAAVSSAARELRWDDTRVEDVLAQLREPRERSWAALVSALTGLTRSRLFETHVLESRGEHDDTLVVAPAVIRGALAVAGGHPEFLLGQWLPPPVDRFLGGAAYGDVLRREVLASGVRSAGWRWIYGSLPRVPFPAHAALDGAVVGDVQDGRLANGDPFPRFGSFFPGDHPGCLCVTAEVLLTQEVAA